MCSWCAAKASAAGSVALRHAPPAGLVCSSLSPYAARSPTEAADFQVACIVVLLALQRVTCALQLFAELTRVTLVFYQTQLQLIRPASRLRAFLLQPLDVRILLEQSVRLRVVLRDQVRRDLLAFAHQRL